MTFSEVAETGFRCDHDARRGECGDVDCVAHTEPEICPACGGSDVVAGECNSCSELDE